MTNRSWSQRYLFVRTWIWIGKLVMILGYEYWGRWHRFGKTYLICIIAHLQKNHLTPPLCSYWHSLSEGGHEWRLKVLACDQEHRTPPITTPTTTTSAFNDTNSRKGIKTPFKKFWWSCYLYSPLTTCYQYAVDCKYCTVCVQTVCHRCQSAWGTVETGFVYFQHLKWTAQQWQKIFFFDQTGTIWKN